MLTHVLHKPVVFSENCYLQESLQFLHANDEDLAGNGTAEILVSNSFLTMRQVCERCGSAF